MFFTVFLWILVIVIGTPLLLIALSLCLGRFAVDITESMDRPAWIETPPEQVSKVPARKLRKLVAKLEQMGFKTALGYTVPKSAEMGMNNYAFVLFSPDKMTYAEVFYLRAPVILRVILLFTDIKRFHLYIINTAYFSAWDDDSRLVTTPEVNIAAHMCENDVEQVLALDLEALLAAHQKKLAELNGARMCRSFSSIEDYRRFFDARCKLAHAEGPHSIEEVFDQDPGGPES